LTTVPGNRSQPAPLGGAVAVFILSLVSFEFVVRMPPKKTRRPSGLATRSGTDAIPAQPVWMTLGGEAVALGAMASWTSESLPAAGIVQTA
jgi:hypothetical protein